MIFLYLILLASIYLFPLEAEIQRVTVHWNPFACPPSCAEGLINVFRNVNGVGDVHLNQSAGEMDLIWKPDVGFSFAEINTAMRMIGPSIFAIRLKVRGTISHEGENIFLTSLGDGSRFELSEPVPVRNTIFGEWKLTPENQQKLLAAEKEKKIATIEGTLLNPHRTPVIDQLMINSLQFENPHN